MSTGVAGRTDYGSWDRKAKELTSREEKEEEDEKKQNDMALGLDGRYATSQAEADERIKATKARQTKMMIDGYQKREAQVKQVLSGLLYPLSDVATDDNNNKEATTTKQTIRITRGDMDAGKRVLSICDTSGSSPEDVIIVTSDLSDLESVISTNRNEKSFADDAENDAGTMGDQEEPKRKVRGLIKMFVSNVHNCALVVKCKIISGTIEIAHCTNLVLKVEAGATVSTIQVDLCEKVCIEFRDAVSGRNTHFVEGRPTSFWGDDSNDRVLHAGTTDLSVSILKYGFLEHTCSADYRKDGAKRTGNATAEETQFAISLVKNSLVNEMIVRHGGTTGQTIRPMTRRELEEETRGREKGAGIDANLIKFVNKDESQQASAIALSETSDTQTGDAFTTMSESEISRILQECEVNKSRGNEAFAAGEYAQAILLYTVALDKASELPDLENRYDEQLFPRHLLYSNRAASFLKMGEHEKALADATKAESLNGTFVKAIFRKGLSLHAMGRYQDAIASLAKAEKLEPRNKQIKQALHFAEVRMTQEMRKRMDRD